MWIWVTYSVLNNKKNAPKNVCLCYVSLLCYRYIQTLKRKHAKLEISLFVEN